jgi:hypothetical protein
MRMLLVTIAVVTGPVLAAQAPSFHRGQQVEVRKADGTSASPFLQTVIALGGDRLKIDQTGVYVNDEKVTTLPPRVVEILPRENETIPAGHVFVAGEERSGESVGRGWNLIPLSRVSQPTP